MKTPKILNLSLIALTLAISQTAMARNTIYCTKAAGWIGEKDIGEAMRISDKEDRAYEQCEAMNQMMEDQEKQLKLLEEMRETQRTRGQGTQ